MVAGSVDGLRRVLSSTRVRFPPRTTTWRWLTLLGATTLVLGVVMAVRPAHGAASSFFAELVVDVFGDTEYGPAYGESAFAAVATGSDESAVLAALGAPLAVRDREPGTRWLYANGDAPGFATTGEVAGIISYTILEFDAGGTFVGASGQYAAGGPGRSQIELDPSARSGRNHLGLDEAAVDRLRARRATLRDLEGQFGKPRAVWTSAAVRELLYSRSPTSTHHHIRSVGIDDAGKVCWKRRDVYWD